MPFHSVDYCKSTAEMLYYIEHQAPSLWFKLKI
jgi:tryptophan 2,3-dioxygenase